MLKKKLNNKENNGLVTVIIPTMDRPKMLRRCINSILLNTYKNLEIIVSDDSRLNKSLEVVKQKRKHFHNIKYIKNTGKSVALAINNAIRLSKGEFIFILDDDNKIDKNCIAELVKTMNKNKNIGIVGPLALYYTHKERIMHAGVIRSSFMRRAIYLHENEIWDNQISEGEVVEDFANAFMFRRNVIYKSGLWDLLVPHMGEDADFEARVRKAGYKVIINPKAITYHDIPFDPKVIYFLRVNEKRMYHSMHSKVLYVYRYDTILQKLTFTLSIPIYLAFYIRAIIKDKNSENKKGRMLKALFKGTFQGFADAFNKRSIIERIR